VVTLIWICVLTVAILCLAVWNLSLRHKAESWHDLAMDHVTDNVRKTMELTTEVRDRYQTIESLLNLWLEHDGRSPVHGKILPQYLAVDADGNVEHLNSVSRVTGIARVTRLGDMPNQGPGNGGVTSPTANADRFFRGIRTLHNQIGCSRDGIHSGCGETPMDRGIPVLDAGNESASPLLYHSLTTEFPIGTGVTDEP
jgi:hypothetical protein